MLFRSNELARAILEPMLQQIRTSPERLESRYLSPMRIWASAALVAPEVTVELVESLPEPEGLSRKEMKNSARVTVAKILALPQEEAMAEIRRWCTDLELLDRVR